MSKIIKNGRNLDFESSFQGNYRTNNQNFDVYRTAKYDLATKQDLPKTCKKLDEIFSKKH